ncbi:HAMP domain-containing histidine kinase, partial [Candidatus Ozemobacteraceae bacterium]|nr:HAMP domain-containing histidine kinase [Candidatus Ozemobacteraceae bacterium]
AEELREQRRLREETERRSEGLARIVSGVAHEIRNPLNTLSLGLDSLLAATSSAGEPPSSDVFRRFELLKQTVREANGLVQNLLQTTRPILPHPQTFDLARWLEDLKLAFETAFPSSCIKTPAIGPTPIETDPELLRRLAWNLVANAAQAGADTVSITFSEDRQSRVLSVSDNGSGLPEQIVEYLFMAGNTTRPDGTGLGLYNAYRLAAALGGSLMLAGTGPSGTTFELRLHAHPPTPGGLHDHTA